MCSLYVIYLYLFIEFFKYILAFKNSPHTLTNLFYTLFYTTCLKSNLHLLTLRIVRILKKQNNSTQHIQRQSHVP